MDEEDDYVPFASTSSAVFTIPYYQSDDDEGAEDEKEEDNKFHYRRTHYDRAWRDCNSRINTILSSLHDAALGEIVAFVHGTRSASCSLLSTLVGRQSIRTGLLIGASPGSSSLLFSSLCRQLLLPSPIVEGNSSRQSTVISRISSRNCVNVKSAMRAIIAGFLGSAPLDEDEEGEEIVHASFQGRKPSCLLPEDMQNLVVWYAQRYQRADGDKSGPTLVVLVEDLESTNPAVLSAVLQTCSVYIESLPIMFLIGVATSASAIHSALPRSITNLLETATFFVEPGIAAFNALIKGIFIDWDSPLSIGSKVYEYLLRTFEDSHHSIDATISGIQYLYMRHFEYEACIFILSSPPNAIAKYQRDRHVLGSLQDFPSVVTPKRRTKTFAADVEDLKSDNVDKVIAVIDRCRMYRSVWQRMMRSGFDLLVILQAHWARKLSTEQLMLRLMKGELSEHSDVICDLIVRSDAIKISRFLHLIVPELERTLEGEEQHDKYSITFHLLEDLTHFRDQLLEILARPKPAGRTNLVNGNCPDLGIVLSDSDRAFSQLVRELTASLRKTLTNAFRPSTELLLNEIFFTNDAVALKHFHPSLLRAYHKSLTQKDSQVAAGELESDAGVACRLYRETGKIINLGDWWNAFDQSSIDETSNEKRKRRRSNDEDDGSEGEEEEEENQHAAREAEERRKHARFIRAIGDLAHVGFLQPSKRKPEHVSKSVF